MARGLASSGALSLVLLLSAVRAEAQLPRAAPTPPAAQAAPPNTVEQARRGMVVLERQGKPLAMGVVLEGDGRILSALSPLTNGNFISARYHDGAVVPLKLAHSDRGWDLALLVATPPPGQALRKNGLRAARTPSFVALQTFTLSPGKAISVAPAALKLTPGLLGGDATSLVGAYELERTPTTLGAPIVNAQGEVVALVARACPAGSGAGCTPAPYGAPVSAIKQFLQKVPTEASWLGVEVVGDETKGVRGVRVSAVIPDSPAAVAGLRPGKDASVADLVVAVDGTPVASLVELNEQVRARAPGDSIELLLFGMGRYRQVTLKPRPSPQLTRSPDLAPKPGKPRTPNPYR